MINFRRLPYLIAGLSLCAGAAFAVGRASQNEASVLPTPVRKSLAPASAYGYAYVLKDDSDWAWESFSSSESLSGTASSFFSPSLNLSALKKPVMRIWGGGTFSVPTGTGALNKSRNYVKFDYDADGYTLLPNVDGVRIGLVRELCGRVLTVGEMPENKEDIVLSGLKVNVLKGIANPDEDTGGLWSITPASSPGQDYWEAEVSLTHDGLSTLSSAFAVMNMYEIQPVQELAGGGETGEYTCVAVTPSGEVPMLMCATESLGIGFNGQTWLMPAATSEIRVRCRFPYEGMEIYCAEWPLCEKVVQPGCGTELTPRFDLSALTGVYGDVEVGRAFSTANGTPDANTTFDLNADGIMEFFSPQNYALYGFKPGFSGVSVAASGFTRNKVLGFVPATPALTLGYEAAAVFSVDEDLKRTVLYETSDKSARLALIDHDNDGKTDFLNTADNTVIVTDGVSAPAMSRLSTMTREEYYDIAPPAGNPLGSGLSIVGNPKTPPAVFASYMQTDINGDGYPDFVDAASGNYYMNLGDGRFVKDTFGGTLLFRDFDGDGINDFLVYDSKEKTVKVYLQRISGESLERKLISGFNCSDDIWCRDFDADGDVDILIPFNASDNGGLAFLVMFENNGQGTFKKREYPIDTEYKFKHCVDWNADGKYEVLTDMEIDRTSYATPMGKVRSYAVDGMEVSTTPEYVYTDYKNLGNGSLDAVADVDNSGRQWLMLGSFMLLPSSAVNTRPDRPEPPVLTYDDGKEEVTVTWKRGSDRETAPADLTYELRVGTTPDGGEILCAAATKDGLRRNLLAGNCGHQLMRKLNTATWPQGKIYVSMQAIDASGRGSEFSTPAVLEKKKPATGFIVDMPAEGVAVYEACTLRVTVPVPEGSQVQWSLNGGEIIGEEASAVRVMFATPGSKTVTMTVTSPDGSSASMSREVKVLPVRFEEVPDFPVSPSLALDLDLDGKAELMSGYFFEGDDAGNYTKVNRLFNTKNYYYRHSADINRDGLPDIIHSKGHLINEGYKSMDDVTPDDFFDDDILPDLDHDGCLDACNMSDNTGDKAFMKNSGDCIHYIPVDLSLPAYWHNDLKLYDVNGDGWHDIISHKRYYENQGGLKFVEKEFPVQLEEGLNLVELGDFDGDGRTDYVVSTSNRCYIIVWSDGTRTELGLFERYLYAAIHCPVFDFDNNGCMDLIVNDTYNTGTWEATAILFNRDHSFTTTRLPGGTGFQFFPYYRSDGKMGMEKCVIHGAPNELPSAPTGVKAAMEGGYLVITWDAAQDKETPAANLRYNLSVRHRDADGEQAYVVSPLNGGLDGVPLPTDADLISGTRYAIPLISMSTGAYEVKVQAVDGRCQAGAFSQPVYCDVTSAGYEAPKEAMVGNPVNITFSADVNLSAVDYGVGAVVEKTTGQTASVYWTSAGTKTITAGNISFDILVHPELNACFAVPASVESRAWVHVSCDNIHHGKWKFYMDTGLYVGSERYWRQIVDFDVDSIDGNTVALRFPSQLGKYKVRRVLEESYGSHEYESTEIQVYAMNAQCISIVDIDDETGKYCVRAGEITNEDVSGYMVFRETSKTGEYEYLGDVQGGGTFVDMGSNPKEHTSRYALKKRFWYGESVLSSAHQPIHAQISMGINSEWNISWTGYEGRTPTTYRILRGRTPQALECIAEVSANTTSYTDYTAQDGIWYYAVETLIEKAATRAAGDNVWRSRSNTVQADPSGVDGLSEGTTLMVKVEGTDLLVSGIPSPGTLTVFGVQGMGLMQEEVQKGSARLDGSVLADGIYILTHTDKAGHKRSVRFVKK